MATIIEATSIASLWCKTYGTIKREGIKVSGIQEIPNLIMVLRENFGTNKTFDKEFRRIFGDERIDYASSVTFVKPKKNMLGVWSYEQNDPKAKWNNSYWGRMIAFQNEVNQIEAAIKKLGGKNTKMISVAVYDPVSDSKKVMGGVPCLSSVDIKPRNQKLDITAFFRSMRFSKAGYADIKALCDLGLYLCERTGMEMGSLTLLATSGHNFYSGEEAVNGNALLQKMGELAKARKK